MLPTISNMDIYHSNFPRLGICVGSPLLLLSDDDDDDEVIII
jgi:hypothetical protein